MAVSIDRIPKAPTRVRRALGGIGTNFVPYVGAIADIDLGAFDITTTGLITAGNLDVDTLNLNGNVISDSTGTISFANENLGTTGTISATGGMLIPSNSAYLYLGEANELSLIHNGTDSIINTSTGKLFLDSPSDIRLHPVRNVYIGDGAAGVDYQLIFDGENSNGTIQWDEDGKRFDLFNEWRWTNTGNANGIMITVMKNDYDLSGASTKYPVYVQAISTVAGSKALYGLQFLAQASHPSGAQTGPFVGLLGQSIQNSPSSVSTLTGAEFRVKAVNTGVVTNVFGGRFKVYHDNTKVGDFTTAYSIYIDGMDAEDGNIGTGYGMRIGACAVDGGTFGTYNALWIADQTAAGTNRGIVIDSDTIGLTLGGGQDMLVYYDGVDGNIDTSLIAPSDLEITCGAQKTLELQNTVWKDINLGAGTLSGPPGLQPGIANYVDEVGADTGIATFGIAVGEGLSGNFEMQHDYKEGSDIIFHVHWQGIAAPTGTDNVQWQLTYTLMGENGETLDAVTVITTETAIDTQYGSYRSNFAAIIGTNIDIENQLLFTIQRIAASANEYGGEALLATVGIHYEVNTLGSRQITTK